jgi:hypothetical protein
LIFSSASRAVNYLNGRLPNEERVSDGSYLWTAYRRLDVQALNPECDQEASSTVAVLLLIDSNWLHAWETRVK